VYALGLVVIAAVYIGFAVADGRPNVIAVESSVTFAFVIVAAAASCSRALPPPHAAGTMNAVDQA
jgi:hypothetical protein